MTEERPVVQLAAAPTIEIGDINDITGTISDKERHVTSGKVEIANVPLAITGNVGVTKTFTSTVLLNNVTVAPSGIATGTSHVEISAYETKTIVGKAEFDGTLHIDVSPSGTTNYFQDVYTSSISSGESFSASFTEAFDYMVVRVENTSSATGNVTVWACLQG